MEEKEEDLEITITGYMSVRQAAQILKVKPDRVYEYIYEKRLTTISVSGLVFIPELEVVNFKRNPSGRTRKQPPRWRVYQGGSYLLLTDILVETFPGKEATFKKKLEALNAEGSHLLTGTIHRFISQDEESPSIVHIWLVWKTNEMPDDAQQEQEFKAFQAEFAGILDWENARENLLKGLLYT